MSAYPPASSQGYTPPPETSPYSSYGSPSQPAPYGGSPAYASPAYAPPPGAGSGYAPLPDEGAHAPPQKKKLGCIIISAVVLAFIVFIFLISATAEKWSRIELQFSGSDTINLYFYLGKVKEDGGDDKTWHSYSDFKKDFDDDDCSDMSKKFKTADDDARGMMVLPYLGIIGMLGLIIFTMVSRMKHHPINMAMAIISTISIALVLMPSGSWSDNVPSLDDLKKCFGGYDKLTYWPSHNGPVLLFISAVFILITAILACVETSNAKKHYKRN
eukprot:TRINITY_DN437_c0_g1_i1.p1 TRINITY_DN437_c0_g1~~TRINITY_DN437_c0_g1_i1.p1  ORF type:complete len:272 (-),score=53.13 TRINITY_DN437_c0_g1_i1:232-1047(-)